MKNLISVIVPVYNVDVAYLAKCINSIATQTYENLEILLVDDGSTQPDIYDVLHKYQTQDRRIRVIHKKNEGVAQTRQQGVEESQGDYLFFLDCDDYLTPKAIELLYNKVEATSAQIIIGDFWFDYNGKYNKRRSLFMPQGKNAYLHALLRGQCNGTLWGKLFHKSVFHHVNLLEVNNKNKDNDVEINFIIAQRIASSEIVCLGEPVYYWLQRVDSAGQQQIKQADSRAFDQLQWINQFVNAHFDSEEVADDLALRNLSTYALTLMWGIPSPNKSTKKDIHQIYWKNRKARQQLSKMQKIIILSDKFFLLGVLYNTYRRNIKPLLKRYALKLYIKNT